MGSLIEALDKVPRSERGLYAYALTDLFPLDPGENVANIERKRLEGLLVECMFLLRDAQVKCKHLRTLSKLKIKHLNG